MTNRSSIQSYLGKYQGTSINSDDIKRQGWVNEGILVINMEMDMLSAQERTLLERLGTRLYGYRTIKGTE